MGEWSVNTGKGRPQRRARCCLQESDGNSIVYLNHHRPKGSDVERARRSSKSAKHTGASETRISTQRRLSSPIKTGKRLVFGMVSSPAWGLDEHRGMAVRWRENKRAPKKRTLTITCKDTVGGRRRAPLVNGQRSRKEAAKTNNKVCV
jgi:hypothetical protein